jgi:SOS-response transcriptional repressor LexA
MKKHPTRHRRSERGFPLAGEISQGLPIDTGAAGERLMIPPEFIEEQEVVFRAARRDLQEFDIERGDLLIVEQRPNGNAASGELVVAMIGDRVFVGHWWIKHGRRAVVGDLRSVVAEEHGLHVLGAVNGIVRVSGGASSQRP